MVETYLEEKKWVVRNKLTLTYGRKLLQLSELTTERNASRGGLSITVDNQDRSEKGHG